MWSWSRYFVGIAAISFAAAAATCPAITLLMVTDGNGSLTTAEDLRKSQLESLGYTVTTVWDNASQPTIDAAIAAAHVVYVPFSVNDSEVGYKLRTCTKGVVNEERLLDDEFGLSTQGGIDNSSYTSINITDNTHFITSVFNTGPLSLFNSTQPMGQMRPTAAAGLATLGEQPAGTKVLAVVEAGATLANTIAGNGAASGRRVHLPWGGDAFDITTLNANAQTLALRAIDWAINDDRVLHLKLNETNGMTAADSSIYARPGTVTGSASWIAARRQNGFDFNGSTKIEVNSLLGKPTNFTLACWVRIDAADTSGAEAISVGDYLVLRAHSNSGGGPEGSFFSGGSAWTKVHSSSSLIGRGWHHLAVTFDDAANSLRLYIDGVNVATANTPASVTWSGQGTKTRVGQHGNSRTDLDFDGAVDDVRVYRAALSPSQVADLYGLVGQWNLAETEGTTAADASGKALHGMHTNGPSLGQEGPHPGAGRYAASFDGVNDYVNGALATNYAFADGFSIAAWVNLDAYLNNAAIVQVGSVTDACALAISATGQVKVMARSTGGVQTLTSTATLPLGRWKHVVGTYDGATLKAYLDGQLVSSTNAAFSIVSGVGNLTIAASLEGADEYLNSRVHGARLYNRAIAADEVAELYGLVGRWKLDESAGTVAADSSGQGAHGTYANGPALAQVGAYDNAIAADGADDYVTAAETPAQRMSNGLAVSAWVRPASTANATRVIVNKEGEFQIALNSAGEVQWSLANTTPGWGVHSTGAIVSNNRWAHIAVSYEDGMVSTYVDGVLKESFNGAGVLGDADASLNDVRIAGRSSSPSGQYFAGRIDEVRIYNRPLSTLEVADLSGLWGYWKFDEGAGTTAADATLAANHGAFSAGSPNWVAAVVGNGLEFDFPNDEAATGNPWTPPAEGTVALWFRSDGAPASRQRLWGLGPDFEMWQDPDGLVSCDVATDGFQGGCITATPLLTPGRWYHLAVVFDSDDDTYSIYLNGALHKSGVSSWGTSPQAAGRLSFGTRTGSTERFDGALDEFRIFNRKLSAAEVSELFGMVGWYKLDETSGLIAADSTGLGNDGAFAGAPTLNVPANGSPAQGAAAAFDGTNSVQIPGIFNRPASVSAAAWVRVDATDSSGADVVSLGDHFKLTVRTGSQGALAAYYNGSTWVTALAPSVTLNSGWHHLAAVLRDGDSIKIYVDGVEAATTPLATGIVYAGLGSSSRIATHGNSASTFDLTGRVDDVRIFNRAMAPDEVFQLYRGSRINGLKILRWVEAR
jgi:hypothetical protein